MGLGRREFMLAVLASGACNPTRRVEARRRIRAEGSRQNQVEASGLQLLAARHPGLGLPRLRLGSFPSRVDAAAELSRRLGLELWLKRDDLAHPLFGGGKLRKLELLLADALHSKRTGVITFGGAGSNQCLATALFAPRAALPTTVVLAPQPKSDTVRARLRALAASSAELRFATGVERAQTEALAREQHDPRAPYVIPAGGTGPLGNLAFAAAAFEMNQDVRLGRMPEPRWIVLAGGTLGSAVGLCLGLELLGSKTRVLAVRASSAAYSNPSRARRLFDETVQYAKRRAATFPAASLSAERLVLEGRELGRGYGHPTPSAERALRLAADTHGLRLETTYTAKALAALLHTDRVCRSGPVLLWLTQSASRPPEDEHASARIPAALREYLG
ncbi:MAG: pyridoxal-phosphate dependent enzyme [Polyangiaceae bacterium]